jgi:MYXO-CTERM domain-containing protein
MRASFFSAAAVLSLALSHEAYAVEVLAECCSPSEPQCEVAPITFSKLEALPIQGGFDTGWVPANSPLQVHLFAQLYAETGVDLAGELRTTWPEALELATPATPGAGSLSVHYGVDIGAEAAVTVTVLGQTYSWMGDIPFVPQFDFQVDASSPFDPWAFDGVSVDGTTMEQTLAQVDVTDFIGINIPGLSGGFELNTSIDLQATYRTKEILVTRFGQSVEGGSIASDGDTSSVVYPGGPNIDVDVQPVGEVVYQGTLHLIPAFYIDTIGPDFSIPVADIPIPFEFTDDTWNFTPITVHVPLPDIAVIDGHDEDVPSAPHVVDLGTLAIGETRSKGITIRNEGEEVLESTAVSSSPAFSLDTPQLSLSEGTSKSVQVSFTGEEVGVFDAIVTFDSNDPDEPTRVVEVRARVEGEGGPGEGGASVDDEDATPDDDGCDCRAGAGQAGGGDLGGLTIALAGLAVALRRRSSSAHGSRGSLRR